jgi:hypothetical protein
MTKAFHENFIVSSPPPSQRTQQTIRDEPLGGNAAVLRAAKHSSGPTIRADFSLA